MSRSPGRTPSDVPRLLDHLSRIADALDQADGWTLFLDFDGTLAPIVEHPECAKLPASTANSLSALAKRSNGLVIVISGRALLDVQERVGLQSIHYAGNHGLEIAGPTGLHFVEPTAKKQVENLARRSVELASRLAEIPGVRVEPKGLTTSIHYRRVDPSDWNRVKQIIEQVVSPDDPDFGLHGGKRVHEIRPRVDWNKGKAAAWMLRRLERQQGCTFFLGDDETDEDAFRELGDQAITARVEPFRVTQARYRLADPVEVGQFLCWMADR